MSNWDAMLPGPASRNNGGSIDCSTSGLLAYGAGSSIAVLDSHSFQLISVLPMPSPSSTAAATSSAAGTASLSPYITSVRWTPQPLSRDLLTHEPSNSHLLLAAGDRQGRIALFDFRFKSVSLWFEFDSPEKSKLGIQDLCWIRSGPDSHILASINGPSLLSLWRVSTGRCFYKYDASPEYFSCIRRDPFDSRHFCVLGLKGFLLSVKVLGETEDDVVIREMQVRADFSELQKLERDGNGGGGAPALAVFPLHFARLCFSPQWKHILFVTFPRELVVFDLQYETVIFSTALPRGSAKFMDVLADPDNELLYCAHVDGKLSTWKRKEGEQVHTVCSIEELMPSFGTSVPSPSVLAVAVCQLDSTLHSVGRLFSDVPNDVDFDNPFDFCDESLLISKTQLISISDDGKVWHWMLTAEGTENHPKEVKDLIMVTSVNEVAMPELNTDPTDGPVAKQSEQTSRSRSQIPGSAFNGADIALKISLVGQMHLLSSTVTVLAVPCPSLTATLARGGNHPGVAVPLVALGTQSGTIDVVDVSANAVAASFSIHSSMVRGLRWLGNSRLVSFSYTQVNEKAGSYINKLVVTCVRSGLNRAFRVLQKPERAPIRALRASSSGRLEDPSFSTHFTAECYFTHLAIVMYLIILFRDAPVEVWAMTKSPIMLRSLALPFTVLEWTLPTAPRPVQNQPSWQSSLSSNDHMATVPAGASSQPNTSSTDPKVANSEASQDDISESFAFALVNGALGVFEVHGRRIRDFRPKWPSSSFVSSDGLITAMAYRLPHVVMGDRSGNIRWWDVTTGHSSSFNTHREGIRRIKFSTVVPGDHSRGRIAVLFYDNTFSVFDLDSPDPLANSLLQPRFPGTLVLELDWLHLRTDKNDPLVLCIAGADSSFRLVEVNVNDKKPGPGSTPRNVKERFRPVPLCAPILLPTPHALVHYHALFSLEAELGIYILLTGFPKIRECFSSIVKALRMILQLGVKSSWFNSCGTTLDKRAHHIPGTTSATGDLRRYMMDSSPVGDSVVPELLLKVLEAYRKEGCILDDERARLYASIAKKGSAVRFAFAAAIFGESSEALFWLQLPHALTHLMNKLVNKSPTPVPVSSIEVDDTFILRRITSKGKSVPETGKRDILGNGQLKLMAFEQEELWASAAERIPWHEKLDGEEAIQNRVHELVSVGNLEAAVSLLLSTPPEGAYFYANALRAVALSSAVSRSLLELAVKVVAANMVRTDKSLSGTHLLCAVGRYQEACSQLQDAGCWTDAATLAATHLQGSDYARVLQKWADHVLRVEHNIWRALILYVAAGALQEALAALRESQQPDTAAMFIVACREIHTEIISSLENSDELSTSVANDKQLYLPGLDAENEDVIAVSEYYGQYQRKLVHLCMDSQPYSD
ncbi:hypothetical protein RJ641_027051 [Dillenia turbinata]|uniref:Uncharacterized protein n=1 Tax=Dillenia turbinata TaxID=194707 RepID=A0AAN8W1P3_9MAGN